MIDRVDVMKSMRRKDAVQSYVEDQNQKGDKQMKMIEQQNKDANDGKEHNWKNAIALVVLLLLLLGVIVSRTRLFGSIATVKKAATT